MRQRRFHQRRSEKSKFEVNLFDPDSSSAMFHGSYVAEFEGFDKKKVCFVYRKIDVGTLLEITNMVFLLQKQEDAQKDPPERTNLERLEDARTQMHHRWEVLQKCIVEPQFENLAQIEKIPWDWQIELYKLIMHGVLGGDTPTVSRFRGADEVGSA